MHTTTQDALGWGSYHTMRVWDQAFSELTLSDVQEFTVDEFSRADALAHEIKLYAVTNFPGLRANELTDDNWIELAQNLIDKFNHG